MSHRRVDRLNEQFKRELSAILQREIKDPRVGGVTISRVETTPDLYHARVFLTTLASDVERDEVLTGLAAASPFLRGQLGRRLRIRRTPELEFVWDRSLDHARRIEQLLAEVRKRPEPDESGGTETE